MNLFARALALMAAVAVLLLVPLTATGSSVGFQGILTNSAGDSLLTGTYDFEFAIFTDSTGGSPIWSESHDNVLVNRGVYQVRLGSITPLPVVLGANRWLEIAVNDTTLAPRLPIMADFRALESERASNSDSVNHIPASVTPQPGHLLPLGASGRFPSSALPDPLDSVMAGAGLFGARTGSRLTLNVGAGDGISVSDSFVTAVLGTSIQSAEIENGAVTTAHLADGAVTTTKIANDAVTSAKIANGAVGTVDIAAGAVTTAQIANDAVTSAQILNGTVATVDLANGAVTTAKIAGGAVTTPELANGAVTTAKIAANAVTTAEILNGTILGGAGGDIAANTITTGEIVPNIVSSVDGVSNDGGDIDLIAGANITIVPDNVAKTVTISAAAGAGYEEGRCIEIDANTIANTMTIVSADECLSVAFNEALCRYTLTNEMSLDPGRCVDITYDANNCAFTVDNTMTIVAGECVIVTWDEVLCEYEISIDPACADSLLRIIVDSLVIDSVFHSEIYVRSVVITPDGTMGSATGHFRSDGVIEGRGATLSGSPGDSIKLDGNGTWEAWQDGQRVAGLDSTGEIFARSFYAVNANGDTVAHVTADGRITGRGVSVSGMSGNEVKLNGDGTWQARQNGLPVAGLDSTGEIFARSFYVKNAAGDTLIHLTSDGRILGPGGQPVGSAADSVFNSEVYARSFVVTPTGTADGATGHFRSDGVIEGRGVVIRGQGGDSVRVNANGTIDIFHNGTRMGGFSEDGEFQARSYELLGVEGDITGHIYTDGSFDNVMDPTNGSGHLLWSDGTWTAYQNGQIVAGLDAQGELFARSLMVIDSTGDTLAHLRRDGGLELSGGLAFIDPHGFGRADFAFSPSGGLYLVGNLNVFGKINALDVDPIISEVFAAAPGYSYEAGMALVADLHSDAYIPCDAPEQTSVVGVVAPGAKVDERGNIRAVILGAAAPPMPGIERPEVRVKADASYGRIRRGDLLTTSATRGHVMKAENPKPGTIVGKALDNLEQGTGEIRILVTLH